MNALARLPVRIAVVSLPVLFLLLSCSGSDKHPASPTTPPFQVMALLTVSSHQPEDQADVVVVPSKDGYYIFGAIVTVNGDTLESNSSQYYETTIPVAAGQTVSVTVSCQYGSREVHTSVPAQVLVSSPTEHATLPQGQSVFINWTVEPKPNSIGVIFDSSSGTHYQATIAGTLTSFTVPSDPIHPGPAYIEIQARNGTGEFPEVHASDGGWCGKEGIWVYSLDDVYVVIAE